MIDVAFGLAHGWPEKEWVLNGDEYENLIWLDKTPKPTLEQITEAAKKAASAIEAEKMRIEQTRQQAIAHAKTLGFTDEMISVIYPTLMEE